MEWLKKLVVSILGLFGLSTILSAKKSKEVKELEEVIKEHKKKPILIFDEATSSVDNETELLLQKALQEISKDRTTIVIAHRLSTVRNADNIFVLGNNSIIESGNHDELLHINGVYNKLWEIQTGKISLQT